MNNLTVPPLIALLIFPGGLFLMACGLLYEWIDRKLVARFQNRIGPRWFQPLADMTKLLAKEEITPVGVNTVLFFALPVVAVAGAMTAALYVPMAGFVPVQSFRGDLIITLYMLSLLTLCLGLAGANTLDRFSIIGATRTLTQLFSYEAPFLLALLGPAIVAKYWQITEINFYAQNHTWMMITQPIGFLIALIGLMGKLELPPFDAPEAETEIVAGAMTEYSGRGFALVSPGEECGTGHWSDPGVHILSGRDVEPIGIFIKNAWAVTGDGGAAISICPAAYRPDRRVMVAGWRAVGSGTVTVNYLA